MTEANRGLEVRAIPGADGGFDLDSFIDSLFRGRSPSDAPARPVSSNPRSRAPENTGTSNDPMNRPGAPALN
jgi:hypothetical protein